MRFHGSFLFLITLCLSATVHAAPMPVAYVDLGKYVGDWYQISHVQQIFEPSVCACARQRLSANTDGTIAVYNSCNETNATGELKSIAGVAVNEDPVSNAKFTVDFNLPWMGSYWIVGLDAEYRYAVVTDKDANSLYILSRAPVLDPVYYQQAVAIAQSQGLKVAELQFTDHTNCVYP